jgi:hypothetical protein
LPARKKEAPWVSMRLIGSRNPWIAGSAKKARTSLWLLQALSSMPPPETIVVTQIGGPDAHIYSAGMYFRGRVKVGALM